MSIEISGEERAKGPSVNSEDPNERKQARRNRINRRLQEAIRNQCIADGTYTEPEPEISAVEETIEACQEALRQLYMEGKEQVTNIMVARDAKEVERQQQKEEEKKQRMERLREDSTLAMTKLDEISKKWETLMETSDPLQLHQHMKEQKAECLKVIEQKNELIKAFQSELKIADERYMKNRKEMYQELSLITKRIDEQVLVMKRAYRIELEHVEETIGKNREETVQKHSQTWQAMYDQREKDEVNNMERKFNMIDNFHKELRQLHVAHEEKHRETLIKLETDIQVLEQELEQIKALCLLNSEKLDYNYQVLKKREEENVYIKNHQKRRLNKLQDMVNTLKKKIEEKKKATEEELKGLTKDVERYHTGVLETDRKAGHFAKINDDKFNNVWNMKDEEAKDLLNKIRIADRIIFEQILGLTWPSPPIMSINKTELSSYKSAFAVVNHIIKRKDSGNYDDERKNFVGGEKNFREDDTSPEVLEGHRRLLHHILGLIADQTGFLTDQRLSELLEPYTDKEKAFVRLDSVFAAISIKTEKDIETMKASFLPFTYCMLCDLKQTESSTNLKKDSESPKTLSKLSSKHSANVSAGTRDQDKVKSPEKIESDDVDEESVTEDRDGGTFVYTPSARSKETVPEKGMEVEILPSVKSVQAVSQSNNQQQQCDVTHPLIVEKHNVLKALKAFVYSFHADRCRVMVGIESKLNQTRYVISRLMSSDDITLYWEKYKELMPQKLENIWNITFLALMRYLEILQERHKVNLKAQALRKQNQELKRLLACSRIEKVEDFSLPVISSVPNKAIEYDEISKIISKFSY